MKKIKNIGRKSFDHIKDNNIILFEKFIQDFFNGMNTKDLTKYIK